MHNAACRWKRCDTSHIGREPSHSIRHAAARLTNTIHIEQAKKKEISRGLGVLASSKPGTGIAHLHQVGLDALLSRIASHFALSARTLAPESAGLGKVLPSYAVILATFPGIITTPACWGWGSPSISEPPGPGHCALRAFLPVNNIYSPLTTAAIAPAAIS